MVRLSEPIQGLRTFPISPGPDGSWVYAQERAGEVARQDYFMLRNALRTDFPKVKALQDISPEEFNSLESGKKKQNPRYLGFDEKSEKISGGSVLQTLVFDQSVLRPNGLWVPSITEARVLQNGGSYF